MLLVLFLSNIDDVTMVTNFEEFNRKYAIFVWNFSKIVAWIGKFSESDS